MNRSLLMLSLCMICAAQAAPRVSAPVTAQKPSTQCATQVSQKTVGLSNIPFSGLKRLSTLQGPQVVPASALCNANTKRQAVVFHRFLPLDDVLKALKPGVNPLLAVPKNHQKND
ncbi:hypothetical protein DC3_18260 [Deinococcus cellulosilyticus NBRC 106333 = KACC 11606]|uniref:Uncharacterized protein n=1 Tax=Deinococcus cellulosilyticus (strain DSM 18568 / NBRC 106333 / KACC 11606 / 5516J-15) TaxID=1223518 RepID=A0A511N154_DEIC1|nr:hypothetical protein DC3_18260 [Deinococcus cellulosilyticus NBRC 106333 = KACC 11606]